MMSVPKLTPRRSSFFFLVFLSIHMCSFESSYCMISNYNSNVICPEIEKEALLSFKQSLTDPLNQLSSWNDSDVNCCKWKGVICNNFTGHVHELRLQNYDDQYSSGLHGKINPSLLNLKQLRLLNLSYNEFEGPIPSFIGSFPSLERLDLSYAGFHGTIPHSVGNLSNLRALSLESNHAGLDVDNLGWLSGLSQLEYLNMNGVNLNKATADWVRVINKLSSIIELHFQSCSLNFIAPPNDHANVSSLAVLDLSNNTLLSSVVPRWIFQLNTLIFLDLSSNSFEGPISSVSNTTKLQYLELSDNSFNSTIPEWLYFCKNLAFVSFSYNFLHGTISNAIANVSSLNTLNLVGNELSGKIPREIVELCKMQSLDLSYNKLQGEISDSFGDMPDCFLGALKSINLSHNQLSGHLTDHFGEFKSLQTLDLSYNLLSGAIPTNLEKLLSLEKLCLESNKLTGNLPEGLGQLLNLKSLVIGYNMLEGIVTESHLANFSKLRDLSATGNHLTLKVNRNWIPPFKLEILRLGSWDLGVDTNIPSWLDTQKYTIYTLDLSNIGISGPVPSWFWRIRELNLANNHLHGKIPDGINNQFLFLSSNQFSDSLPRVGNSVRYLDLSNNSFSGGISDFLCDGMKNETYELQILHLGENQLTGELPDCWMKWPSLQVLNLGDNNLFGSIHNSISFLVNLRSLNLYKNRFSGQIPFSMHKRTQLMKIDLSHNNFDGNIPSWMGTSITNLRVLILRSNKLSGKIPLDVCLLTLLQILDLSDNKCFGTIPKCFNNFSAMATKRSLSGYNFGYSEGGKHKVGFRGFASVFTKGREFQYSTILPLVTNMDLSDNNLSGDIPKELTSLVELGSLNLSGNHLTGLIPNNIGDMKQLESLDFSRNSLSGRIPKSFTTMSSLDYLNLSFNNLTGRIPESTQILSLDASSFIGNNLCGPPLPSNCSDDNKVPVSANKEDNEDDKSKVEWFYVFLSSGYAVGFSVVCLTLIFKKSWRGAYFGLMEDMWNKLCAFFCSKWRRLAKRE